MNMKKAFLLLSLAMLCMKGIAQDDCTKKGVVGNCPITMYLEDEGDGHCSGWLYYNDKGPDNKFQFAGVYDGFGNMILDEYLMVGEDHRTFPVYEKTGIFRGKVVNGNYSGHYTLESNEKTSSFEVPVCITSRAISEVKVRKERIENTKHEFVDLGLPSGLRWSACDLGSDSPEEKGVQLQYDDIFGIVGEMPEAKDFNELIDVCKWQRTVKNGVEGYNVVGPNGNSIFLSYASYWTDSYCGGMSYPRSEAFECLIVRKDGYYMDIMDAGLKASTKFDSSRGDYAVVRAVQDYTESGNIGEFPITMYLEDDNHGSCHGWYYYNRKGPKYKLSLSGTYDDQGNMTLYEYDEASKKTTGVFVGKVKNDRYEGEFKVVSNNKTYTFSVPVHIHP